MTLICFDLDGTLVDPLEGMHLCLQTTCKELGLPCPDRDRIAGIIGMDLEELFRNLPSLRRREILELYWRHFEEEGIATLRVLAGAHLLLARLKRQGQRLFLVSSQPAILARRTLHFFDLNLMFDDVIGLTPLESWKPKQEILDGPRRDGVLRSGGYLIGDRADDMRAAKAHGLIAVGVTYGYGKRQELIDAKAEVILDSMEALDGWLGKELQEPEIHDPFSRAE